MRPPRHPLLGRDERQLDLRELDALADAFDADVVASPEIDQFCSSTCWTMPAAQELMPPRQPAIRRSPDGWLAFMFGEHAASGRFLEPLEASWGLACPLVGPDPVALVHWLADVLEADREGWDLTLLAGIPAASQLLTSVAFILGKRFRVLRHGRTGRHVASLAGGLDGFLSRRSRNLRRSVARAQATARQRGVTFEHHAPHTVEEALALFARVQRVEAASWKGRAQVGIAEGAFGEFYRNMVPRLARRKALHLVLARHGDADVAFLMGGVFGQTFRGLQMSFHESHRDLALGNLCQIEQISRLPPEVTAYDLGASGLDYKSRWAEQTLDTEILVIMPS